MPHIDLLSGATWVVTISGNYSGGFLIANCAGKKCTARCLQRVAQQFSDVCTLWSSYQWANISAEPHVASNVRYIAFPMKTSTVLTHLTSKVRHFHVTPFPHFRTRLKKLQKIWPYSAESSYLCRGKDGAAHCAVTFFLPLLLEFQLKSFILWP